MMAGKKVKMAKERFEILLEDINSDVKAIAEGQGVLQNQIDSLKYEVKALDNKIDVNTQALKKEIAVLDKKNDINAQAFHGLLQDTNDKIDKVEKKLGDKIDRVEAKLDAHMKQPAHA